jgi:pilus assembly protein CpaB
MSSIRPQTVTLATVAVLFGLVSAYVVKRSLEPKAAAETAAPKPPTATVLVAQTNLSPYARIREADVAAVEVPLADAPSDAMRVRARAVGRLVKSTIVAGHPVRELDLYEVGKVPLLADQLPPGYRAVTVKLEDASAINGVLQPGCFVDVALTFDSDHPDVDGLATVNLMRHLKVLTPGPSMSREQIALMAQSKEKTYITVAATPDQANRLILAQKYGFVSVTLCSNNETGDVLNDGNRQLVNKYELLGLPAIPPPLVPVPEEPIRKVVEIYRGTDLQQVVFNESGELLSTEMAMSSSSSAAVSSGGRTGGASGKNLEEAARDKCPTCHKRKVKFGTSSTSEGGTPTPAPPPANQRTGRQPTLARPVASRY